MSGIWGQPGKAGKTRRPEPAPAPRGGPPSPGNAVAAPGFVFGVQPVSASLAARLGVASALTSPMVAGRFRPQDEGSPVRRGVQGGTPDLGALQTFRGLVGRSGAIRGGAQGGPSSPAGYPSTGNGTVLAGLAAMSRPDVQRIRGL